MKKALYIGLLVIEVIALFIPIFFVLYLGGMLAAAIAFIVAAAIYAFLAIYAAKQKKAGNEAGLKKAKIITALVCPAIYVVFIIYFIYVCEALGVI